MRLPRALDMPRVDLGLQILALGEQRGIARGEPAQQIRETLPEGIAVAAQRAQHFGIDESGKLRIGFDSGARYIFGHGTPRGV